MKFREVKSVTNQAIHWQLVHGQKIVGSVYPEGDEPPSFTADLSHGPERHVGRFTSVPAAKRALKTAAISKYDGGGGPVEPQAA